MANHKSELKRARQNELRRERNRAVKTRTRGVVKNVRVAVEEGAAETAAEQLKQAASVIAKAAKKGVIHRNAAARKISRLAKLVNKMSK